MSFLDVAKNQVTSRITARVNKAVHSGLTRVAGNLPGSSIGIGSNNNPNSAAMQQKTRFTTQNITYPLNVEGDPMQGHYIMFMVNEANSATLHAEKSGMNTKNVAKRLKQESQAAKTAGEGGRPLPSTVDTHQIEKFNAIQFAKRGGSPTHSLSLKKHATTRLDTAISLYMPPSVSVSYGMNYADKEIGLFAETGAKVINKLLQMKEISLEAVTSTALKVGTDLASGGLQGAKQAGIAALDTFAPGAETLIALHRGAIITPRMELMLEGVGRRSFSYTFMFIPKSVQEAKIVEDIIYAFKFHMHPEYVKNAVQVGSSKMGKAASKAAGKVVSGVGREMTIPSTFDIAYMYQGKINSFLNKISTCFLTNMDVQYGAERFTAYEPTEGNFGSGPPPQRTQISLTFNEMEIITKERIAEGY
jgi:hypothetical protein